MKQTLVTSVFWEVPFIDHVPIPEAPSQIDLEKQLILIIVSADASIRIKWSGY